MEPHYTHNISFTSSGGQYEKYEKITNNEIGSSSSDKDYFEKNKSQNDWSKI